MEQDVPLILDFIKQLAEYEKLGAEAMEDWTVYRIAGARLEELGKNNIE